MAKDAGWGRRLRSARRAYEERHDVALTYTDIGERLGERLKRPAFKHTTVRAWFVEGQEPESFEVARELAALLDADIGDLIRDAKKPAEGAGQFDDIEAGAVALTPAQIQRAVEKSARNEAARRAAQTAQSASPRKRKGNGAR